MRFQNYIACTVAVLAVRTVSAQSGDWAVLLERSPAFDSSGTMSEKLAGGTVVERISEHNSSIGKMYRCRILTDAGWKPDYFILEPALVMFTGSYESAPKEDSDLVVRYCQLKGKIDDRNHALKEESLKKNPHFEEYKQLANEISDMESKSESLVAKRDSIAMTKKKSKANTERHKVDDELRKMRGDSTSLMVKFKAVETKYKQWQSNNPADANPGATDPLVQEYTRELETIRPRVSQIVEGI